MLVLCKLNDDLMPKYRKMFAFVSQLKAGKGLTVVMAVVPGDFVKRPQATITAKQNLRKYLDDERVKGFVDVLVTKNVADGLSNMWVTSILKLFTGRHERWKFMCGSDNMSWQLYLTSISILKCPNNWSRWLETEHRHTRLALWMASRWRQTFVASILADRANCQRSPHGTSRSQRHQLLPWLRFENWWQYWRVVGRSWWRFAHALAVLAQTTPNMEKLQDENFHDRTIGGQLDSD